MLESAWPGYLDLKAHCVLVCAIPIKPSAVICVHIEGPFNMQGHLTIRLFEQVIISPDKQQAVVDAWQKGDKQELNDKFQVGTLPAL